MTHIKFINSLIVLVCVLTIPTRTWGQFPSYRDSTIRDCPVLPFAVRLIDSTIIKHDTKLVSTSVRGGWRWVERRSGWAAPQSPNRQVDIVCDQKGQWTVYEQGKRVSAFTIRGLKRGDQQFYFNLNEQGKPFFAFSPSYTRGFLRVCDRYLVIGELIADGREWAFERMPSK